MAKKTVKQREFRLEDYIGENKKTRKTSFPFKEAEIAKLPFTEDRPIDLYDSSQEKGEWKLVLRINKTCKTFHIRNSAGMKGKIGTWMERPTSRYYPKGFVSLAQARKEFTERVDELAALTADAALKQKWTIRRYLDEQYAKDRLKKKLRNGKIKAVSDDTIKEIKQGFEPWLDKRLMDADDTWPEDFQAYWNQKEYVVPRTQQRKIGITSETQRKYYTMLNAMFHICVKMGYLRHNPIDHQTARFERNDPQEIRTYEEDYDYEEIVAFIFDKCDGSLAGKLLIATIILTGTRPSEIYRNTSSSFDERKKTVFIPAAISKNSGQRRIAIKVERYWIEFRKYKNFTWHENTGDFMFPSTKSASGHSGENLYKKIWKQIKIAYNITSGVLYDNRHTFATLSARESSVEVTAGMLGDTIETTYKYYYKNKEEDSAKVVEAIHSKRRVQPAEPTPVPKPQTLTSAPDRPIVHLGKLPGEVLDFYEVFIGGKEIPEEGHLYKDDWNTFIQKIEKRVERGRMSEETEDWLDAVT
jgi:integrase